MSKRQTGQSKPRLWERILVLLEDDLAERRSRRVSVEVLGGSEPYYKEIGELSQAERRSLDEGLRGRVADLLLDRYLAEQGRVDLLKGSRFYTKDIRDLIPDDLPALIAADWEKTEEFREEREREKLFCKLREDLDRLRVAALVG